MIALERFSFFKYEYKKEVNGLNALLEKRLREECTSPGPFSDEIVNIKNKKSLGVLYTRSERHARKGR